MKDSEIVSKLIFLAFIATPEPVPFGPDERPLLTWHDAMGLYARSIEREASGAPGSSLPTGGVLEAVPADHFRDVTKMFDVDKETCATLSEAIAALEDPEAFLDPEPESVPMQPGLVLDPPPIYEEKPSPLEGTVDLRAKDLMHDLPPAPKFRGPYAQMKRETYERMTSFRQQHGLGSYRTVAEASDGAFTEWQLRDMMDNKPTAQMRWDALKAALDRLEGGTK